MDISIGSQSRWCSERSKRAEKKLAMKVFNLLDILFYLDMWHGTVFRTARRLTYWHWFGLP